MCIPMAQPADAMTITNVQVDSWGMMHKGIVPGVYIATLLIRAACILVARWSIPVCPNPFGICSRRQHRTVHWLFFVKSSVQ